MNYKQIGRSELKIAPLMFGGNVFGWTTDKATSFNLIDAWLDAGFNAIDTADVYSRWVQGNLGGESETIIGNWLKAGGARDKIIIATKLGKPMGENLKGLSAAYIKQAVEASLKRLNTDYIDLYQAHEDDANTPLEETMQAFSELIQEGKVRVLGASNYSAKRFSEALEVSQKLSLPRYECMQPEFNLFDRQDFEADMQALCLEEEVGVINYFSLAAGFLTGKYRSHGDTKGSARADHLNADYFSPRGLRILKSLDEVADEVGTSPAAVTLAWELTQPAITAPIVSATSLKQLQEIKPAASLKLDDTQIERLNKASQED